MSEVAGFMQLLLVSTCDVVANRLTECAQALGSYRVVRCYSPIEAALHLDSAAAMPRVVLLDLPVADVAESFAEASHLQRLFAADDAPAIVLDRCDGAAELLQAFDQGATEWLAVEQLTPLMLARSLSAAIEHFQARSALRELTKELDLVLANVPVLMWSTGSDLCVRRLSRCAQQLFDDRTSIANPIGRPITQLLKDAHGSVATRRAHLQAMQGERVTFDTECQARRLQVHVAPLQQPDGGVLGTIGVAVDITDQCELTEQLSAARQVQESLLPRSLPQPAGVDLAGAAFPAHVTGGDWYDVLEQPDGSLVFIVGDVSGHDLPATILAAACSAYVHALMETAHDWQQILTTANQLVWKRTRPQDFAVLQLGWLNAERTKFLYAGAGDRALIIGPDGVLKSTLASLGPPLGLFAREDVHFDPPIEATVSPGDTLLLMTDGFREARNPAGDMFGEARIIDTIARCSDRTAEEMLRAVYWAVEQFVEGEAPEDDMSGIVVKIQPREPIVQKENPSPST